MARRHELVRVIVVGRPLQCVVCSHDTFSVRPITLITSGVANSGANKRVDVATCSACGYLHQFVLGSIGTEPVET